MVESSYSAAEAVLLAAVALNNSGRAEFTEWDLTVKVWQLDPNRFGLRGYERKYPDHKRVMSEIMGTTKLSNPLRKGWMVRTKVNRYRVTPLGIAAAALVTTVQPSGAGAVRPDLPAYDAVEKYVFHSVFQAYRRGQGPRSWLDVAAFLGLRDQSAVELDDCLRAIDGAVTAALAVLDEGHLESLSRRVDGTKPITKEDLHSLRTFVSAITEQFSVQVSAIRRGRK